MSASPARRAAFETVQRVFEQDAYADRAFPAAAAGLEPRSIAINLYFFGWIGYPNSP